MISLITFALPFSHHWALGVVFNPKGILEDQPESERWIPFVFIAQAYTDCLRDHISYTLIPGREQKRRKSAVKISAN